MTRMAIAALLVTATSGLAAAGTGTVKGTVTSAAGPVADAVVLVDAPPAAGGSAHAVIDQRNETFVPHVLAVAAGTTVDFPNSDSVLHNVSSASPAKPFDLGMYLHGEVRSVTFDKPGVVEIRCNVHPRMSAFVVVHSNPWAAVTDGRGGYTLSGVPAGTYTLRVWHESLAEQTATVTIRDGGVQPLDVRLERRR